MSDIDEETIHVGIVGETDLAFQLENDDGEIEWFPKSQLVFERRNVRTNEAWVSIPCWLLDNKGW